MTHLGQPLYNVSTILDNSTLYWQGVSVIQGWQLRYEENGSIFGNQIYEVFRCGDVSPREPSYVVVHCVKLKFNFYVNSPIYSNKNKHRQISVATATTLALKPTITHQLSDCPYKE